MNSDDTLNIYALRLERLSSHAFRDSSRDRDRQLCRKFWKTVPEYLHRVLSDGEKSLALHGGGNKLDWEEMVRLAASEDRYRRERREERSSESEPDRDELAVWYSRPSDPSVTPPREKVPRRTDFSRKPSKKVSFKSVYNNSQMRSPPFRNRSERDQPKTQKFTGGNKQPLICNWRGKRGHNEGSCWAKTGQCFICDSDRHNRDGCPQFNSGWTNSLLAVQAVVAHILAKTVVNSQTSFL